MQPTTNTRVKIRYGLILQGVLARALAAQGYAYDETPAYDDDSEVPDFLIPNSEAPQYAVEVHQTDARDHFRMKTLRSLTAVAEAKAFFGPELISVNVLFGDPDVEVPEANLRAMCGIFDVNVLLQRDATDEQRGAIRELESEALEFAQDTGVRTADAANQLAGSRDAAVSAIGGLMASALEDGEVEDHLQPMWEAEQERRNALDDPPAPGNTTFYKKNMIRSLFFQDEDFDAMVEESEPDAWPESAGQQVVLTKIGEMSEDIDGDHLVIDPEFAQFLRDPDTPRLRGLCKAVLDENEAMHWFFEDIRDSNRRQEMTAFVLDVIQRNAVQEVVLNNIWANELGGIEHRRCWVADILAGYLGVSHNRMNVGLRDLDRDPQNLGNPFNQICYKSERFMSQPDTYENYAEGVSDVLRQIEASGEGAVSYDVEVVSDRLLNLRLVGAMRLRQLDVLPLMSGAIANSLGLKMDKVRINSVLSDLADEAAVGRFELFYVSSDFAGSPAVLLNLIATEGNPRDKAKEWGARRLATLYRHDSDSIVRSEHRRAIFVLDGTWAQSDVTRLYRSGWDYVVRMGELEETLRKVFAIH